MALWHQQAAVGCSRCDAPLRLEPLAVVLRQQETASRQRDEILTPFVAPEREVLDTEAALRGACDILAEEWAEDPEIRQTVHEVLQNDDLNVRENKYKIILGEKWVRAKTKKTCDTKMRAICRSTQ